jgi:hypothetical protein
VLPERREVILNPLLMEGSVAAGKDFDSPTVLWLGRVDLRKGAELLPGIMKGVWREVPEAKFIIAGYDMGRSPGVSYQQWIGAQVVSGQQGCWPWSAAFSRVQQKITSWRQGHPPRSCLPETLWRQVAVLARGAGIARTAQTLRLDYYSVKKHVAALAAAAPTRRRTSSGTSDR